MPDRSYLAWPFFDDAHRAFANDLEAWAVSQLSPIRDAIQTGNAATARQFYRRLGQAEWLRRCMLPRDRADTTRPDLRLLCLLRECLAYAAAISDVAFSEPWLGSLPISLFGGPEIRAAYLPSLLDGTAVAAFALSEPDAGSDAVAIATTAVRDGNHFVISGRKTWISNAGSADLYIVFARTGEAAGAQGISAFIVDGKNAGITLEKEIPVLSSHSVGTLRFDGCRVPADHLIGQPGIGFRIAMVALNLFRPTVGAAALGFARRALDEALNRSTDRMAFGRAISDHQITQQKIADMAVKIDAAALLIYRAAWLHDAGSHETVREAAIAKLYATETAQDVVDQAVQILGGAGLVRGHSVASLYGDVRPFRIFDGSSEIQRLIVAKQVLREDSLREVAHG